MNKEELRDKVEALSVTILKNEKYDVEEILVNQSKVLVLIDQLDEPEKPAVPRFVADWIEEEQKENVHGILYLYSLLNDRGFDIDYKLRDWIKDSKEKEELFIRAFIDGYTVEEPRYRVKVGNIYMCRGTEYTHDKEKAFTYKYEEAAMKDAVKVGGTIEEVNP